MDPYGLSNASRPTVFLVVTSWNEIVRRVRHILGVALVSASSPDETVSLATPASFKVCSKSAFKKHSSPTTRTKSCLHNASSYVARAYRSRSRSFLWCSIEL